MKVLRNLFFVCLCLPKSLFSQDLSDINETNVIVYQPKVSFDGKNIVFMANYDGRLKPYVSTFMADSLKWSSPKSIFPEAIIDTLAIQYPSLSFDNQTFFFSGKGKNGNYDIFQSSRTKEGWSNPEKLMIGVNSSLDELGLVFSSDMKKVLFTRNFPEETKADDHCFQLWKAIKDETGQWQKPEPLEPFYNTGCVCAPYYSRDNESFYYSSYEDVRDTTNKVVSRNQFNIFWAKSSGGFFKYKPIPILELVGGQDHTSFSIVGDSIAYFAAGETTSSSFKRWESGISFRRLPEKVKPDPFTMVRGRVIDQEGGALNAKVSLVDPFTSEVYQETITDSGGGYQVFLPQNQSFSILVSSEGYSLQSRLVELKDQNDRLENFKLFSEVEVSFRVFDSDFYFAVEPEVKFYDSAFNPIEETIAGEYFILPLGKEINAVFTLENYFADTLNLPFDKEVIFSSFNFDIDMTRKIKQVSLSFSDEETGDGLGLTITIYNVTRNEKVKRNVKDGKVSLDLRDGEVYEISTSAQGYSYYNAELDLSDGERDQQIRVDAKLKSLKNESIILNNIFFEVGSFSLGAASYEELNKLVNYLIENKAFNVEISAHTDDTGSETFNMQLSNLRAKSVLEYLQDNTINADRLVARGYGETTPLVPNTTEENKAQNRRVEFKIINQAE